MPRVGSARGSQLIAVFPEGSDNFRRPLGEAGYRQTGQPTRPTALLGHVECHVADDLEDFHYSGQDLSGATLRTRNIVSSRALRLRLGTL